MAKNIPNIHSGEVLAERAERCRSFAYLRIGLDVVGILRNGCGVSPATISK